jgi:glycosyltransferase involved in cell wall biosynthesis
VHGWSALSSWVAFAAAIGLGVPILVRGETNGLAEPNGLKGVVKRSVLGKLFRHVSAFLAIGQANAAFYRGYGVPETKIFLTPYSVDNDFFSLSPKQPPVDKRELRRVLGLPVNQPCVLFVGKLVEHKAPLDLMNAFAALSGCRSASLAYVGDGPLRRELGQHATDLQLDNVHFLGFRNQSELPNCYGAADVLVLPSHFEEWGLVINEAMCCGLPVVASRSVGAARDLVREGENGFTFCARDVRGLSEGLGELLSDESVRDRMGQRSREIISGWGIKETAAGIRGALDYVVARRATN